MQHQIRKGSTQASPSLMVNSGSAGGPGSMALFDDVDGDTELWTGAQIQQQQFL